jgi:hypothetical protein
MTEPYLTAELAARLAAPPPEREHVHVHVPVGTVQGIRVRCTCGDDITETAGTGLPVARRCWRCGVDWMDNRARFVGTAPCRDCRDALVGEGADRDEFLRPQYRKPKETPAP